LGSLEDAKVIVLTYGPDVDKIKDKADSNSLPIAVVNARFFKPLDDSLLFRLVSLNKPCIVYETDMLSGGLGSAILEWLNQNNASLNIKRIGIKDHFVTHGSLPELRKHENIDISSLFNLIKQLLT